MTDLDELRVALKSGEYDGTHIMRAWLLVDKVKELEADQEGLLDDTQKLANALLAQEKQVAELTAKLDKAKEALDRLARLGNEPLLGNSDGNKIAWLALKELDK